MRCSDDLNRYRCGCRQAVAPPRKPPCRSALPAWSAEGASHPANVSAAPLNRKCYVQFEELEDTLRNGQLPPEADC